MSIFKKIFGRKGKETETATREVEVEELEIPVKTKRYLFMVPKSYSISPERLARAIISCIGSLDMFEPVKGIVGGEEKTIYKLKNGNLYLNVEKGENKGEVITAKVTVKSLENKPIDRTLEILVDAVEKYYSRGETKKLIDFKTLQNLKIKEKIVNVKEL
ncbi:MAG: hypothetical protein ACTSXW_01565 [Candidatus Baldrarchaeia archaeon]